MIPVVGPAAAGQVSAHPVVALHKLICPTILVVRSRKTWMGDCLLVRSRFNRCMHLSRIYLDGAEPLLRTKHVLKPCSDSKFDSP